MMTLFHPCYAFTKYLWTSYIAAELMDNLKEKGESEWVSGQLNYLRLRGRWIQEIWRTFRDFFRSWEAHFSKFTNPLNIIIEKIKE